MKAQKSWSTMCARRVMQLVIVIPFMLTPSFNAPAFVLAQAQTTGDDNPPENPYGIIGVIQDWLSRANREYQGIIIKELSRPASGEAPEDAIANTKDREGEAAARRVYEDKLKADQETSEQRAADEAEQDKLAEDRRRAEETKRLADEARRKADEIARALAETPPLPDPAADAAADRAAKSAVANERQAREAAERDRAAREAQALIEASRRQEEEEKARAAKSAEEDARRRAEAQRIEDETRRAAAEQQAREQQAATAATSRHRKRRVILTIEPIDAPEAVEAPSPSRRPSPVRIAATRTALSSVATASIQGERWAGWTYRKAPEKCRNAGRRIKLPGRYTVASGDSLWTISRRFYRSGKRWQRIYRVNRRRIADPDLIYPCQRLRMPKPRRR